MKILTIISTSLILLLVSGCDVYRQSSEGDTTMAAIGRDAGVIMTRSSNGAVMVVVDQNESKSFGKAVSGATITDIAKHVPGITETLSGAKTERALNASNAANASETIKAQSDLDLLNAATPVE